MYSHRDQEFKQAPCSDAGTHKSDPFLVGIGTIILVVLIAALCYLQLHGHFFL